MQLLGKLPYGHESSIGSEENDLLFFRIFQIEIKSIPTRFTYPTTSFL